MTDTIDRIFCQINHFGRRSVRLFLPLHFCFGMLICVLVVEPQIDAESTGTAASDPQIALPESLSSQLKHSGHWPPAHDPYSTRYPARSQLAWFASNQERLDQCLATRVTQFQRREDDPEPKFALVHDTAIASPTIQSQQVRLQV